MRHNNSGKKLSRTPSHRKALFRNMAKALLTYGKIRTTETKAMALRGVVDPLISLALQNDLHARRQAYKVLGNHQMVKRLFDEIGPAFKGVSGGFTRVTKLGMPRPGDCAPLAMIELVFTPENPASAQPAKPAKAAKAAAPAAEEAPKKKAAPKKAKAEEAAPAEEASVAEAPAEAVAEAEASAEAVAEAPAEEAKDEDKPA